MKVVGLLICLLFILGCGSDAIRSPAPETFTSPSSPTLPPARFVRQIAVGAVVKDTLLFHGDNTRFDLTVPVNGTLTVSVTWNRKDGRIEVWVDGKYMPFASDATGVVVRFSVTTGRTYRIVVADGAPWDYDMLNLPFVLITSIE